MPGLSTTELIAIVLIIVLLFGATRLPQLAKSLGQSRKAFKEGLREAEDEDAALASESPKQISTGRASSLTDEEILAEMQRRSEAKSKV